MSSSDEDANAAAAIQMPHVFVVPPEEDETPTWCFFDAENPALSQVMARAESSPNIAIMDFPCDDETLNPRSNEPGSSDAVGMHRKSFDSVSVVEALMKDEVHGDSDSDTESEYEQDASLDHDSHSTRESARYGILRNAADDSDVIEVVKVGRRKETLQNDQQDGQSTRLPSEVKRSATLKARASRVFKSLKGSIRSSKPRAQNIFPPVPPLPATISRAQGAEKPQQETLSRPQPPVKRRGSMVLSQLFTAPLRPRSSMGSMDGPSSPTSLATTYATTVSSASTDVPSRPLSRRLSRRSSISTNEDRADVQEAARLRAASPTPTRSSSKSSRFSVFKLQRMFSFSSHASPAVPPVNTPIIFDDSRCATPTRSNSCTPPSVVSSASTSAPQTPTSTEEMASIHLISQKDPAELSAIDSCESAFDMNAGLNLGLGLGLELDFTPNSEDQQATPRKSFGPNSIINSWRSITPNPFSNSRRSQAQDEADTSLEMRLDSFHFDDLSFDAGKFTAN